ncbi:hypothetical protein [Luteolibacter sp. Populi]|uniref:hypothetical protein n=1 Tax=Luteolibacter sp. Populi TaxID=3230487 RepID=UPI003466049E
MNTNNYLMAMLLLCGSSCDGRKQADPSSETAEAPNPVAKGEEKIGGISLSHPFITDEEYAAQAQKAQAGDGDAAFALYNQFSYGKRDYGLAYFWAMKAKALGNPKITDKTLGICETNIMSQALSKGANWHPPESMDELPPPHE